MSWEMLRNAAERFNAQQNAIDKILEIAERPEVLAVAPDLKAHLEVLKTIRNATP